MDTYTSSGTTLLFVRTIRQDGSTSGQTVYSIHSGECGGHTIEEINVVRHMFTVSLLYSFNMRKNIYYVGVYNECGHQ